LRNRNLGTEFLAIADCRARCTACSRALIDRWRQHGVDAGVAAGLIPLGTGCLACPSTQGTSNAPTRPPGQRHRRLRSGRGDPASALPREFQITAISCTTHSGPNTPWVPVTPLCLWPFCQALGWLHNKNLDLLFSKHTYNCDYSFRQHAPHGSVVKGLESEQQHPLALIQHTAQKHHERRQAAKIGGRWPAF
jgi:hypothetical protein